MADCALQRMNMVESQVRPSDVTDRRILRAMQAIPRELFVPPSLSAVAYMDDDVALIDPPRRGQKRRMMSPRNFARLAQFAHVEPTDRVLYVGAGRGYGVAIVARLASTVVALECDEELAAAAKVALEHETNVTLLTGPLTAGNPGQGPYDVVFVEGAVDGPPATLMSQLKPGGRLVAVLLDGGVGRAAVWRRDGDNVGRTVAFEAAAAALPGFERTPEFNL